MLKSEIYISFNSRIFSLSTAISLILILAFSLPLNAYAEVNKCNINGKIVYPNKACSDTSPFTLTLTKDSSGQINSHEWLQDFTGYQKALKISAIKGAPIFIYGYTDWCRYCKKLHQKLFRDSSVKAILARFIKVKINPEHSAKDKRLFNKWGGRGYPTLFTQATARSSPSRTNGPFTKKNGKWIMMTKNEFIRMLRSRL